jgi:hypothetical protein
VVRKMLLNKQMSILQQSKNTEFAGGCDEDYISFLIIDEFLFDVTHMIVIFEFAY